MNREEYYNQLDQLIDSTESLEALLKKENLSLDQAKVRMQEFITHANVLFERYNLNLRNQAFFCQSLQTVENITRQDLLWLYTSFLCDKGLLFDTQRSDRSIEQDISCYLKAQEEMAIMVETLSMQTVYNATFRKIKGLHKILEKPMPLQARESDTNYILKAITYYFPIHGNRNSEVLTENITLLCSLLANSHELLTIAPLFIYQVVSNHKSRLFKTEFCHFQWEKLWTPKLYQITTDNGKNFTNINTLLNFFLDLCDYFGQNSDVNIKMCRYIYSELSNICDYYYTHCEYNEKFNVPLPMSIWLAKCNIYNYENSPEYDEIQKDYELYVKILSVNLWRELDYISNILNKTCLSPNHSILTGHPILRAAINSYIGVELNKYVQKVLFQIGKRILEQD